QCRPIPQWSSPSRGNAGTAGASTQLQGTRRRESQLVSIHTYALWALATVALVSTPNLTAEASYAATPMAPAEGDAGTMTVPQQITAGSEIQIQVSDPSRANQTVMVKISSGDD